MKLLKLCLVLGSALLFTANLMASDRSKLRQSYEQGTILKVDKREVSSPDQCCYSGTDSPLKSEYFAYDVSVRVQCGIYVAHYETAFDFLPSELAADRKVDVRVANHDLYFDVPGAQDIRMAIVRRRRDRTGACTGATTARQ